MTKHAITLPSKQDGHIAIAYISFVNGQLTISVDGGEDDTEKAPTPTALDYAVLTRLDGMHLYEEECYARQAVEREDRIGDVVMYRMGKFQPSGEAVWIPSTPRTPGSRWVVVWRSQIAEWFARLEDAQYRARAIAGRPTAKGGCEVLRMVYYHYQEERDDTLPF